MLLIGGRSNDDGSSQNSIWRLGAVSGTWTENVALQKAVYSGTAILVDNAIYSFGINGNNEGPIQRIDIENDFTIKEIKTIGDQGNQFWWPILLVVDTNADCVVNP